MSYPPELNMNEWLTYHHLDDIQLLMANVRLDRLLKLSDHDTRLFTHLLDLNPEQTKALLNALTLQRESQFQIFNTKKDGHLHKKYSFCKLFSFFCVIVFLLFMSPFFIAITKIHINQTNYCDNNYMKMSISENVCVECPEDAQCSNNTASCKDKMYLIDPENHHCVEWYDLYRNKIIKIYGKICNVIVKYINNYYDCNTNEWIDYFRQLTFEQFCKLHEMDICVWFFILVWYCPSFRCLIIFLWSTMIIPAINNNDEHSNLIMIYLKLLSYFTPIIFIQTICNKCVG